MSEQANRPGNRLGEAISPYLLQHRDNPVHWREWSPAALAEAEAMDRPILLSIGYAACHWCHVMAHESFEDPAVAAVMNRLFVNVKVDREERPDIDHLYMSALQAMGEQGGWPMTMFLTPRGEPFYGGTYYPPLGSHGRPGFTELLEAVSKAWTGKREGLLKSADTLGTHLRRFLGAGGGEAAEIERDLVAKAAPRIAGLIDPELGGMRGAPKFPNAPYLELLARSAFPAGPAAHREGFLTTLRALCEGGIYDHVGGGLHRYSTDARWLVPHFEKMLYDQAQFLRHLLWGWRATGEPLFRRRIEETVAFLEREMKLEGGGFAASLDADSPDEAGHMEEGAFYVWSPAELDAVLAGRPEEGAFRAAYGVEPGCNWEGRTILDRLGGAGSAAGESEGFAEIRGLLLARRATRPRPGRDDKLLADWNGLLIRALAEIGAALPHSGALALARGAFEAVTQGMTRDGRLHHAARDGRLSGVALAGDYGALIAAAAALFLATGDAATLAEGRRLADALDHWHGDGAGGHMMTAKDAGDVLVPLRGDTDDAVPGATALVVEGLALLAQAGGDAEIAGRAARAGSLARGRIGEQPAAYPGLVSALDRVAHASELTLLGFRSNPGFTEMETAARGHVDLNRADLVSNDPARLPETLAVSALRPPRFPAAILCRRQTCRPPVFDPAELEAMLREA